MGGEKSWRCAGVAAVLAAAGLLSLPSVAGGATISVTTTGDALAADASCSLREAVSAANLDSAGPGGDCAAGSGADTVSLPGGHFTLSRPGANEDSNATGDLDILGPLTIAGAGQSTTTISANQIDRVLEVRPGRVVAIQGVTITGGRAPNGANGSNVTGASGGGDGGPGVGGAGGPGQNGGGILNAGGTLTIVDSTITGNAAGSGGTGGTGTGGAGVSNTPTGGAGGAAQGGTGGAGGAGGGIFSSGTLTVSGSAVIGNVAGAGGIGGTGSGGQGGGTALGGGGPGGQGIGGAGGGGGVGGGIGESGGGALTIDRSTIRGNTAGAGGQGGLAQGGEGGVSGSSPGTGGQGGTAFAGSGGAGGGGGISADDAPIVTNVLIDGNVTGAGGKGGNGSGGSGGAIVGSTGNAGQGGGAIGGVGGTGGRGGGLLASSAALSNVTITANAAADGGAGGNGTGGRGGGVSASGDAGDGGVGAGGTGGSGGRGGGLRTLGTSTTRHATITANGFGAGAAGGVGTGGASGSGGTPGQPGATQQGTAGSAGVAGAADATGTATLQNSIVSGNATPSCSGVTDGGNNISFPDGSCPGAQVNPLLGPLADNGGPTRTQALDSGSPAIDAVPASGAGCAATDQRGVGRPQGPACDIGAFEVSVDPPPGDGGGGGGDGAGGGDGTPLAFGADTLVELSLAKKRIPARGPVRVAVSNENVFPVSGELSAKTVKKNAGGGKRDLLKLKPKAFRVSAGAKQTVQLKLSKSIGRLLKRKRKLALRFKAAVTDPAGNTRTVTRKLTLKLKK